MSWFSNDQNQKKPGTAGKPKRTSSNVSALGNSSMALSSTNYDSPIENLEIPRGAIKAQHLGGWSARGCHDYPDLPPEEDLPQRPTAPAQSSGTRQRTLTRTKPDTRDATSKRSNDPPSTKTKIRTPEQAAVADTVLPQSHVGPIEQIDRRDPTKPKPEYILSSTANFNVEVRCMDLATGGTFAFKRPSFRTDTEPSLRRGRIHHLQPGTFIGSAFCDKGVGVYFQIGDDFCFCAHVDMQSGDWGTWTTNTASQEHLDRIRQQIAHGLLRYHVWQGWSRRDIKPQTLVIVSTMLESKLQDAIRLGVLDFLRVDPKNPPGIITDKAHGFAIVPGDSQSLKLAPYERRGAPTEEDAFQPPCGFKFCLDESMPANEWRYNCTRGSENSERGWY